MVSNCSVCGFGVIYSRENIGSVYERLIKDVVRNAGAGLVALYMKGLFTGKFLLSLGIS